MALKKSPSASVNAKSKAISLVDKVEINYFYSEYCTCIL